jgi:DNA polymerase III alpha subunit
MHVEIHTTSAFSFLRGASLPEDLVHRAASLGYGAVALLDRDGVYGAPRFYRAAREHGLHAIVGAALGVEAAGVRGVLGLYVRAPEGYRNLCRLITAAKAPVAKPVARREGVYVPLATLAEQRAGLAAVLLSGAPPLDAIPRGASPADRKSVV